MPLICTCLEGHRWEHTGANDPETTPPPCPTCGAPAAAVFTESSPTAAATPPPFNPQMLSLDPVCETPRAQAVPSAAPASPPLPRPLLPQRQKGPLPRGSVAGPVVLAVILTSLAFLVLAGVFAVLWYQQAARHAQELAEIERGRELERQENARFRAQMGEEVTMARRAEAFARQAEIQTRADVQARAADEKHRREDAERDALRARNETARVHEELVTVKNQLAKVHEATSRKMQEQLREKLAEHKLLAERSREKANATIYAHCIALADWERRAGSLERARRYLNECPADVARHWEHRYLERACSLPLLHSSVINSPPVGLGFSADGKRLAAVARDGVVTIRGTTGTQVASFQTGMGPNASAAFSADGKCFAVAALASAGRAGVILSTMDRKVRTLQGPGGHVKCLALDAEGKRLILVHLNGVKVWDVQTDREVYQISDTKQKIEAGVFSPDGKWLATAHRPYLGAPKAAEIRIREAATGKLALTVHATGMLGCRLAFCPDGSLLAAATGSSGIHLFDPAATTPERAHVRLIGTNAGSAGYLLFTPDGKQLVSGGFDGAIRVWDVRTGKLQRSFQAHTSLAALAVSRDGTRLATVGRAKDLRVWSTQPPEPALVLKGHSGKVAALAFSPDSKLLASASIDRTVRLCDATTGKLMHTLKGHTQPVVRVLFDPTGKRLVTLSAPAESPDRAVEVKLWDVAAGKELLVIPGQMGEGLQPVFNVSGQLLAITCPGQAPKVWDCATGKPANWFDPFTSLGNNVHCMALTPDGERLAISDGNTLSVHTHKMGKDGKGKVELRTFPGQHTPITGLAWSADGKRLAVSSGGWLVTVWDMAKKRIMTIAGTRFDLRQASLSQDGHRLAVANMRQVLLMDLDAQRELLHLSGPANVVMSVAFSPDGNRIAAGSLDGTIHVWDGTPQRAARQ